MIRFGLPGLPRQVISTLRILPDLAAALPEFCSEVLGLLGSVDRRLARLEDTLGPVGARLERLDAAIGRLEREIATVAESVAPLDADLKQAGADTGQMREDVAAVRLVVGAIADDGLSHLVTGVDELANRVERMHTTLDGLKGSVESVTASLPGSGTGLVARAREAITAIGDHAS